MLAPVIAKAARPGGGRATTDPIAALGPEVSYDISALTGFGDGDPVDLVTDLSGNGWHGTQATFAQMPTFTASGTGGRPELQFDGADDLIVTEFDAVQPVTVFMVMRLDHKDRIGAIFDGTGSDRVHLFHDPDIWYPYAGNAGNSGIAPVEDVPVVITVVFNGASSTFRQNGVASSTLDVGANVLTNLRFGLGAGDGFPGLFALSRFDLCLGVKSEGEIIAGEQYLASKYSITI